MATPIEWQYALNGMANQAFAPLNRRVDRRRQLRDEQRLREEALTDYEKRLTLQRESDKLRGQDRIDLDIERLQQLGPAQLEAERRAAAMKLGLPENADWTKIYETSYAREGREMDDASYRRYIEEARLLNAKSEYSDQMAQGARRFINSMVRSPNDPSVIREAMQYAGIDIGDSAPDVAYENLDEEEKASVGAYINLLRQQDAENAQALTEGMSFGAQVQYDPNKLSYRNGGTSSPQSSVSFRSQQNPGNAALSFNPNNNAGDVFQANPSAGGGGDIDSFAAKAAAALTGGNPAPSSKPVPAQPVPRRTQRTQRTQTPMRRDSAPNPRSYMSSFGAEPAPIDFSAVFDPLLRQKALSENMTEDRKNRLRRAYAISPQAHKQELRKIQAEIEAPETLMPVNPSQPRRPLIGY